MTALSNAGASRRSVSKAAPHPPLGALERAAAKALRSLTLHSAEYVERLLDEVRVCDLAAAVEQYYADQPLLRVMMMLVQLQLLWGVARACEA